MKNFLLVSLFVFASFFTSNTSAQYVNANWQYNPTKCVAETICPNGTIINCATVGFNYGNAPRVVNNMCRTRVIPGRLVHCQGFADRVDMYGRVVFVPVNIPVRCY